MATIYRCDKCREETVENHEITAIEIKTNGNSYSPQIIIKKDLCYGCIQGLQRWIQPDPITLRK